MGLIYRKKFICDTIKRTDTLKILICQLIDEYEEDEDVLDSFYSSMLEISINKDEDEREANKLLDFVINDKKFSSQIDNIPKFENIVNKEYIKYLPTIFLSSMMIIYIILKSTN